MGKAGALEDHKQWILVIVSGQVDHVAPLVQAGLMRWAGIKTIIEQYKQVANKLYLPKGYMNDDLMHSIVLLRLDSALIAEFSHHSLSLLSLMTI